MFINGPFTNSSTFLGNIDGDPLNIRRQLVVQLLVVQYPLDCRCPSDCQETGEMLLRHLFAPMEALRVPIVEE